MQAAIYARYSSENQRPESIEDQISSCRRVAKDRHYIVEQAHVFTDAAASGAREDRPGLAALRVAAIDGVPRTASGRPVEAGSEHVVAAVGP